MPAEPTNSSSSRAVVWEWTQVALLSANLIWTSLCLGGYRTETMVVTSVLSAALLVVHLTGAAWLHWQGRLNRHPAGWCFLPFLVYAAANVTWVTPVRWLGWFDWLGWAQTLVVFWVVLNGVRSRAARGALLGVILTLGVVAVVLAAYQKFVQPDWLMMGRTQTREFLGRASGFFGIPNSLGALLLLLLPVTVAGTIRRGATAVQRVMAGYLTAVFALGLGLTVSRGAWLALVVALVLWPLFAVRGSWRRRVVLGGLIGGGLVLILGLLYFEVPRVQQRLARLQRDRGEVSRPIMWRGAWRIFEAQPVLGGGAGAYNTLFDAHRPESFQDQPRWVHNDYLNTLCDYGVVGFGLLAGGATVVAIRCRRHRVPMRVPEPLRPGRRAVSGPAAWMDERWMSTALAVGLGAFALQLFVDFHLKLLALAMVSATTAALIVAVRWPRPETGGERALGSAVIAGLLAIFVVAGTLFQVMPSYRGEALRAGARAAIDRLANQPFDRVHWGEVLGRARADLERAVALAPANGAAWADLAYARVLSGHVTPQELKAWGRAAEVAADQALARSSVDPVFFVRRGVALDVQGRTTEADALFAQAVKLAPTRASIWYNYAFHLAIDPARATQARAAVDYCLRLDPGNREAQALRERLAGKRRDVGF